MKDGYWGFCVGCAEICAYVWGILLSDVLDLFSMFDVPEYLMKGDLYWLMDHWTSDSIADEVKGYITSKGGTVND